MSDNYQPRNPYAPNYGARPAGNYGAAPYGQAPYAPSSAPAAPSAPASGYPGGYNNGANYTSNSDNKKSSPADHRPGGLRYHRRRHVLCRRHR